MIVFPNCKINLGLQILRKRADGYHDLRTVFYPVPIHDALEFLPASSFSMQVSGLQVQGPAGDNLCVKAYGLLKQRFPQLPPLQMHLLKNIPMGAGLGGGSADGAFTLKALNNYFDLGLEQEELIERSLSLGSDCPFFILNKPVLAEGRGEIMQPLDLSLAGYHLVLVHPGLHISTREAFSGIVPRDRELDLKAVTQGSPDQWRNLLVNDFEATVFNANPVIREIKEKLYGAGAVYASMTGSGSAVYGIFNGSPSFEGHPAWKTFSVVLK